MELFEKWKGANGEGRFRDTLSLRPSRWTQNHSAVETIASDGSSHKPNEANNTRDNVYYTVLVSQPLHEFTRTSRFGWWMIITAASGCRSSESGANWLGPVMSLHQGFYRHRPLVALAGQNAQGSFTFPRRVDSWADGIAVKM